MTNFLSWKLWVIVALGLGTLACSSAEKRERREQAREERRERAEARREERLARREGREAEPRRERERPEREARRERPQREDGVKQVTTPALTQTSTAPAAATEEGKVVFLRTSSLGRLVTASVFDVTESGEPKFINHVQTGDKVIYSVKPGLATFMVVSEAADFIQVEVQPGKTYYALVTPRMGAMRARFSFEPVRGGDRRIDAWQRGGRIAKPTQTALKWAKDNASDISNKRERYWTEWSSKPESQRPMLRAEDGR